MKHEFIIVRLYCKTTSSNGLVADFDDFEQPLLHVVKVHRVPFCLSNFDRLLGMRLDDDVLHRRLSQRFRLVLLRLVFEIFDRRDDVELRRDLQRDLHYLVKG
jgi:hypothetical protein